MKKLILKAFVKKSGEDETHYYKVTEGDNIAVISLTLEGKWKERLVEVLEGDASAFRLGLGYMSYLTPSEILSWLKKDFDDAEYLGTEYDS